MKATIQTQQTGMIEDAFSGLGSLIGKTIGMVGDNATCNSNGSKR